MLAKGSQRPNVWIPFKILFYTTKTGKQVDKSVYYLLVELFIGNLASPQSPAFPRSSLDRGQEKITSSVPLVNTPPPLYPTISPPYHVSVRTNCFGYHSVQLKSNSRTNKLKIIEGFPSNRIFKVAKISGFWDINYYFCCWIQLVLISVLKYADQYI